MKKSSIVLTTAFVLFLSTYGFSQTTHLHFLVNAVGTNFHYGKSSEQLQAYKKRIIGAQLGASFQAGITRRFSVVTELYFIMKGGELKMNNPITLNKSTIRLYDLEMPLMARFHVNKFHLNAGPYLSYAMTGRIKTEDAANTKNTTVIKFNNSDEGFKRWDAGIQFGGGYFFNVKKHSLLLDIRYCYGLTSISTNVDRYNRLLVISLIATKPWKKNPFGKNK